MSPNSDSRPRRCTEFIFVIRCRSESAGCRNAIIEVREVTRAKNLSGEEEAFANQYAIHLNALRASEAVGVTKRSAQDMLTRPSVLMRVQELREAISKKAEIDAVYVRKRLKEIDQLDVIDILDDDGAFLPVKQWPKEWRTSVSSLKQKTGGAGGETWMEIEVKWPDKLKNLELLGKHVDVSAWEDRPIKTDGDAAPLAITFNVAPAKAPVEVTRGGKR